MSKEKLMSQEYVKLTSQGHAKVPLKTIKASNFFTNPNHTCVT